MKLYLVGVWSLIIKVDARYIKGMLANPDLNPSAAINRWILAILTFHFELIPIPGTSHGPDGMSHQVPQPGDEELESSEDFDNWIDNLYRFMHMINLVAPSSYKKRPIAAFVSEIADICIPVADDTPVPYNKIPCKLAAQLADDQLELVKEWLGDLIRPTDLSDADFATFVRYAMSFFVASDKLWRKDPQGHHKLVALPSTWVALMQAAHDGIRHKGVYATIELISEHFWWPAM
jgi:hypothetical protein